GLDDGQEGLDDGQEGRQEGEVGGVSSGPGRARTHGTVSRGTHIPNRGMADFVAAATARRTRATPNRIAVSTSLVVPLTAPILRPGRPLGIAGRSRSSGPPRWLFAATCHTSGTCRRGFPGHGSARSAFAPRSR